MFLQGEEKKGAKRGLAHYFKFGGGARVRERGPQSGGGARPL